VLTTFVDVLGQFQRDDISLEHTRTKVKALFAHDSDLLQVSVIFAFSIVTVPLLSVRRLL